RGARTSASDLRRNVDILENTLASFNVSAKVVNVSHGPVVTRYEIQPAPGVKVSKIVNLSDDIAMNLSARDVRIEAPVPGKPVVGIEIPNAET
ncbi:MAG: DNA translocase FtsK, partial [Christensenellaceae bacterium]